MKDKKKQYILVVDDKEENLFILERVLKPLENVEIIKALSGNEALAATLEYDFALIILDVQMPDMDGYEVAEYLREDKKTKRIPIIFLSAVMTDDFHIEKGYESGAIDFLTKPYKPKLLLSKVKIFLELDDTRKNMQRIIEEKTRDIITQYERWQKTFDSINDFICILDSELKIVVANKAMTDYFETPLIEKHCNEVYQCPNCTQRQCTLLEGVKESNTKKYEIIPLPDGKTYEVTLSPIENYDGSGEFYVHIASDITERKLMEDQLRQSEKMQAIGQLAGGVAHDFNNQLTAIMGFASLLSKGFSDDDPRKKQAEIIVSATQRSADLTQKLLSFSRKGTVKNNAFNIHKLLQENIDLVSRTFDRKIEITNKFNAENFIIRGDVSQLSNSFLNLLINAKDAISDSGTITLTTENCPGSELNGFEGEQIQKNRTYILISVSDTGSGIPEENINRIFEPFFTTKDVNKGTGLGLAAVFGTVKTHSGLIKLDSEENKGTTFTLAFPLEDLQPTPEEENKGTEQKETIQKNKAEILPTHILLIDDEESVRGFAKDVLESFSYTVTPCCDGLKGLESYRKNGSDFDLVILDKIMPEMNGDEVYKELLKINPDVKVIFSSGYSDTEQEKECENNKNIGILHKPFDMATLKKTVEKILDQK